MSEIYQFHCLDCNLELKIGKGVGGNSPSPAVRFFCEKCGIVSSQHICEICEKHIKRVLYPRKYEIALFYEENGELRAECPYCFSKNTVLTVIGKWYIDNRVW